MSCIQAESGAAGHEVNVNASTICRSRASLNKSTHKARFCWSGEENAVTRGLGEAARVNSRGASVQGSQRLFVRKDLRS